eukprot:c4819_g1_i1.p1 GENE.c4819_g1_i1~~c4819_g1_i1.p1  ORF type:complete len:336 (+),score=58.34 c4819_g1_i1:1-1008(+)
MGSVTMSFRLARGLRQATRFAQKNNFAARVGAQASRNLSIAAVAGGVVLGATMIASEPVQAKSASVDYAKVRKAIADVLDDNDHDDGSFGPIFVRLAWHASGTYDKHTKTGGSGTGASMRFPPESAWGANAGLHVARARLEPIKAQFPDISYADLWTLAGVVAIEEMGGPVIPWRPGRVDCTAENAPKLPDGLLPNATLGADHLRDIFHRMGLNDAEIVALSGAHTLGRCHRENSGFVNPWTNAPTTFSNQYFIQLVDNTWKPKRWNGPPQYEDPTGALMMLKSDLALLEDPTFRAQVELYARDEKVFFKDFSKAFSKLLELGVAYPRKSWWWPF